MDILFVAGFSPIVADPNASRSFYGDVLGVQFEKKMDDYSYTHELAGVKHLGLWPLAEAAETCFGTPTWPAHIPVPQATIEFEVADVAVAERELREKGLALIHGTRLEPWGQVTARLLSPEGLLVGLVSTPWLTTGE
ncbi:VOC family protein [Mycetocola zhadangensis]|uniref:Glyoxalase n=1 Tax=Mycetocola zhadangensis TaxID=1164595 RepID=A0A3L7J0H9_9MICO|nr:VOC family protein [Mycetocola zhadangensis]RLQ83927.1 glyoxalase [Mycetocola zhadangensis]GGE97629.1 glyoxalase [Mycetocola zhadangensis]